MEDRCVCCGAVIPEGRQVCLICDKKIYGNGTVGMAELKPCPFCGKMPKLHRSVFSEKYRVRCENGCGVETAPFGTAEKAIEAWNRRAEDG